MTENKDIDPKIIEELNLLVNDFQTKHSEIIALRATIAAINRMLIVRNRGKELLESLKIVMDQFEKRISNHGENNEQEK